MSGLTNGAASRLARPSGVRQVASRFAPLTIILIAFLQGACSQKRAAGPLHYQYTRISNQLLLVPPGAVPPSSGKIELRVPKIKPQKRTGCDMNGEYVRLAFQRKQAIITLPVDQGIRGDRVPLALLDEVNVLRSHVRACLKDRDAGRLMNAIIEKMPLPSPTAFHFRFGSSPTAGFIDIDPPLRMKVTAPVRDAQSRIIGFEHSYYEMHPRRGGNGFAPKPEHVETVIAGQAQPMSKPKHTALTVPGDRKYFRLFFLTRRSPTDHDILLVASQTEDALAAATVSINAQGETACAILQAPGISCLKVPLDSAISAEPRIRINGRYSYVPLQGTLNEALRVAGVRDPAALRDRLRVLRPYAGKPIPVDVAPSKPDILGLILIGGEEIFWE